MTRFTDAANQARNQGRRREAKHPLEKFLPPPQKNVLDII